jgi:TonB family protein
MNPVKRIVILSMVFTAIALGAQSDSDRSARCGLQLIAPVSSPSGLRPKSSTTFEDFKRTPIVIFEVDESGTVSRAKIKRRSGSRSADQLALAEIHQWKFKAMSGCGIVQSEAMVTIDFSSP